MDNPLLAAEPLPAFAGIQPEHVEPAVHEILARNRARIGELTGIEQPTFASLIEPLEELRHRLARTWSPGTVNGRKMGSPRQRATPSPAAPIRSTDNSTSSPSRRRIAIESFLEAVGSGEVTFLTLPIVRARLR